MVTEHGLWLLVVYEFANLVGFAFRIAGVIIVFVIVVDYAWFVIFLRCWFWLSDFAMLFVVWVCFEWML